MNSALLNCNVRELLSSAAEWHLLGLLFELPTASWKAEVSGLAAEIHSEDLKAAVHAALSEASEGRYHSAIMPTGRVSLREISYRPSMVPGQFISQLSALYAAFAYEPRTSNPPDHLAVQASFLAYLQLKEAYAQMKKDIENAEVSAHAADAFVRDHLSVFEQGLTTAMQLANVTYLTLAGAALENRIRNHVLTLDGERRDG
jgi:nitrate reductase assembly molybdenum cofactor insertion protein NarJ